MHLVLAANHELAQPWVVDAAAELARACSATVSVVTVDEVELERLSSLPRSVSADAAAEVAAAAVARLQAAGVEATATVLHGVAREQVPAFADRVQADVIVVGATNRPQVATRLLGSVPLALVSRSSKPVLVVPRPGPAAETSD